MSLVAGWCLALLAICIFAAASKRDDDDRR